MYCTISSNYAFIEHFTTFSIYPFMMIFAKIPRKVKKPHTVLWTRSCLLVIFIDNLWYFPENRQDLKTQHCMQWSRSSSMTIQEHSQVKRPMTPVVFTHVDNLHSDSFNFCTKCFKHALKEIWCDFFRLLFYINIVPITNLFPKYHMSKHYRTCVKWDTKKQ